MFVRSITGKRSAGCYYLGMRVAGFVLAGGHSSRMGRDKALLPWHSGSLVEDLAARVADAAGNVALIGDPRYYSHLALDCLPDLRPGQGPLAGIEAALESRRGELNLIVACDMPGLKPQWLRKLLLQMDETGAPCVATRDGAGVLHPLCAVYRGNCLAKVRNALDEGRLRLLDLMKDLETISLETEDTIWNVNTPEDWRAWQMREERTGTANGN